MLALAAAVAIVAVACGGGEERSSGSDPDPQVVARGEQLYAASCVQCHGGPVGGRISDIPPRHNTEGHTWHHPDCLLTDIVLDGLAPRQGASGDQVMPGFRDELSEEDADAILTFLKTWWTEEQRQSQAEVTAAACGDG